MLTVVQAFDRAPIAGPPNFDPAKYELLARYFEALVAAGKKPKLAEFWNPTGFSSQEGDARSVDRRETRSSGRTSPCAPCST